MHNGLLTAFNRLKGAVDQLFPALGQHLNAHIVRDQPSVHQLPEKIKLNLARRGKSDLDLLKSQLDQILEHLHLLFHDHGIDERLISVPQIHAAPHGRLLDLLIGPFSLRIIYHRILPISPVIKHFFSFLSK